MQEKIKLKGNEKILQDILRVILFTDFAVILKGMYNQSKNIDQDYILGPSCLILSISVCSIYGINAFTSGNLVNNWANTDIFNYLYTFFTYKLGYSSLKAKNYTIRTFGSFILLIALGIIIYTFV
jgi:hypothetical protein